MISLVASASPVDKSSLGGRPTQNFWPRLHLVVLVAAPIPGCSHGANAQPLLRTSPNARGAPPQPGTPDRQQRAGNSPTLPVQSTAAQASAGENAGLGTARDSPARPVRSKGAQASVGGDAGLGASRQAARPIRAEATQRKHLPARMLALVQLRNRPEFSGRSTAAQRVQWMHPGPILLWQRCCRCRCGPGCFLWQMYSARRAPQAANVCTAAGRPFRCATAFPRLLNILGWQSVANGPRKESPQREAGCGRVPGVLCTRFQDRRRARRRQRSRASTSSTRAGTRASPAPQLRTVAPSAGKSASPGPQPRTAAPHSRPSN